MSKPFDLFAEFARFGAQQKVSLRNPNATPEFVAHVEAAVERALADPALVYGQWAEAMFEALLVSLGDYALLKPEDVGRVYPADDFGVPDFRVVLKDGRQWLIEVKNVYLDDPGHQERRLMTRAYRERQEAYAAATGGELKLAVFWARWATWTLVTPAKLVDANGDLTLNMLNSMKANEMGDLGDRTIGTRPPLRFRLLADPEKPSSLAPDGTTNFTIGGVEMFCGDDEILNPTEREITWIFMQHGQWNESGPEAELADDRVKAIEYRWDPVARQNEGFETIGTLSRMFAKYYAEMTVDKRQVIQVHAPLQPGWFAPLVSTDYKSEVLPLWKFILQPNYDDWVAE
ncbi:hypothetical protein [Shumkonia mesophila]|uniref:hypothetical protein n=1 Tax=Shumkonia mesophila TaxID=2838854 RepID=UPI002934AC2D|nr:hypothetical protein [Shumkonia mesophila]